MSGALFLARLSSADPNSDLSIVIPPKSLKEVQAEERRDSQSRATQNQEIESEAQAAANKIQKRSKAIQSSMETLEASYQRRIRSLRERIERDTKSAAALEPEIEEIQERIQKYEGDARTMRSMPGVMRNARGFYTSGEAEAERLEAAADFERTRLETRRARLLQAKSDTEKNGREIKRLQSELAQSIGKRGALRQKDKKAMEIAREEARTGAMRSITAREIALNPGSLKRFNFDPETESRIVRAAEDADDAGEKLPLADLLDRIGEQQDEPDSSPQSPPAQRSQKDRSATRR
ncbi:hypothetical protein HYR69_11760 [Candidatus Sumerlaeota bacterium]|nr:hypothetical protein [Candidatus Sumerlaeota bacterium]